MKRVDDIAAIFSASNVVAICCVAAKVFGKMNLWEGEAPAEQKWSAGR
jgi:hypothetical protein